MRRLLLATAMLCTGYAWAQPGTAPSQVADTVTLPQRQAATLEMLGVVVLALAVILCLLTHLGRRERRRRAAAGKDAPE